MSETASPAEPAAVPYLQTTEFEWTRRAFELLSTNTLTWWAPAVAGCS